MRWNREAIVRQALALVDESGLDALTVRRLAERLHVQNPALYRHFTSKQSLLDSMAEMMVRSAFLTSDASTAAGAGAEGESDESDEAREAWDQRLLHLARVSRSMLRTQRDGARIIASANLPQPTLLLGFERLLAQLQEVGFSPAISWYAIKTIFDYTLGAVFEEQADPQQEEARMAAVQRVHDVQPVPTVMTTLQEIGKRARQPRDEGIENSFEAGLSFIISGLRAAHIASTPSSQQQHRGY